MKYDRRCPGIPLIQDGMWLMIARIVATLDIKKKVVNGVPVEPKVTYDNAFLRSVRFSFCFPRLTNTLDPGYQVISNAISAFGSVRL